MTSTILRRSYSTLSCLCLCNKTPWRGRNLHSTVWTSVVPATTLKPANSCSLRKRHAGCVTWAIQQARSASAGAGGESKKGPQPDELADIGEGEEDNADFEDDFFEDTAGEAEEELMGPQTVTGGAPWGEQALAVAEKMLASTPEMAGITLYSFRADPLRKHLDIRLDKMDDYYGSPTLDEIERFCRLYSSALEQALGLEVAGSIDYEVSSPGAERQLRLPEDLERFGDLAMKVVYAAEGGKPDIKIFEFVEVEEVEGAEGGTDPVTVWRLADVRANAPVKGRKLSKKQREQGFRIKLSEIKQVNLYIDY